MSLSTCYQLPGHVFTASMIQCQDVRASSSAVVSFYICYMRHWMFLDARVFHGLVRQCHITCSCFSDWRYTLSTIFIVFLLAHLPSYYWRVGGCMWQEIDMQEGPRAAPREAKSSQERSRTIRRCRGCRNPMCVTRYVSCTDRHLRRQTGLFLQGPRLLLHVEKTWQCSVRFSLRRRLRVCRIHKCDTVAAIWHVASRCCVRLLRGAKGRFWVLSLGVVH